MPSRFFSLMIVDEDREVRDCLTDLFRSSGYSVSAAECTDSALRILPEGDQASWPDVIILGQAPQAAPESFLSRVRSERPGLEEASSLIVFPSFQVPLAGREGGERKLVNACRLSTVSNLLALVRGLARRKLAAAEAG